MSDKNGFNRVIYGGNPHDWLKEYLEYSQKMAAFPQRFINSAEEQKIREAGGDLAAAGINADYEQDTLKAIRTKLAANDSIDEYFGRDTGNPLDDAKRMGALWLGARPPWIRMWTTIQQHEQEVSPTGELKESKEIFRRTYMLGNNIFDDYGSATLQDYIDRDTPGTRGNSYWDFYDKQDKLNTPGYAFSDPKKFIADMVSPKQNGFNKHLFKPSARIKSVTHSVKGARLGATTLTTVNFDVWSRDDFYSIFQRFFLKPGAQIVIDIGRSNVEPYDIADIIDLTNENATGAYDIGALDQKLKELRLNGPDGLKINPANFNIIMGTVTKFDSRVLKDKFECTMTVVSKNRISIATSAVDRDGKISEKFINKIDTFAVLSTIEHILPTDQVSEIWNVNWLDLRKIEDIVAIVGNSVLSSQYVEVQEETGAGVDSEGNTNTRHIKVGDKAIPLVWIPKLSQERGVYVQRLAYSLKADKLSAVTAKPKLKNNVFVSLQWIEDNLLNPLLQSDLYDGKKRETDAGLFQTPTSAKTNVSPNLMRQQLYSNKIRHTLTWLYGSDCNNGGWADSTPIGSSATIPFLFVNCSVVKEALSAKDKIRDIYQYILDYINSDSLGLLDLTIGPATEENKNFQVMDLNYEPEGTAIMTKIYADKEKSEELYAATELISWVSKPILRPNSPGSLIRNIDFQFNVANNKLASMMAIQGGSGNHRFSINNFGATKDFSGLAYTERNAMNAMFKSKDLQMSWKYLPETKTTWEDNASANKDDFLNWHQHVPNIGGTDSLYGRMRMYQGVGAQTNDTIMKLNAQDQSVMIEGAADAHDELNEDERKNLEKAVGVLQKDILKQREKEWEIETSTLESEDVENDDGTNTKWIYAKDFYDFYKLQHMTAMQDNDVERVDKIPRYNPPVLGMSVSITLQGMFGWKIGDAFKIDDIPPEIRNKVYFVVTEVSHTFSGNDWTTNIKASYRLRPGLKFQPDFDYNTEIFKSTKIGLSKTFIQTLGFKASTAEKYSKWEPPEGKGSWKDVVYMLTRTGTSAEYKTSIKEFKARTEDKLDAWIADDNTPEEANFSLNINLIAPDKKINFEPIEYKGPFFQSNPTSDHLTYENYGNNFIINNNISRGANINSIHPQSSYLFDETHFDLGNPSEASDLFADENEDILSSYTTTQDALANGLIDPANFRWKGNSFMPGIGLGTGTNVQLSSWNVENKLFRNINNSGLNKFNLDSEMGNDLGFDFDSFASENNNRTDGLGVNTELSLADGSQGFNTLQNLYGDQTANLWVIDQSKGIQDTIGVYSDVPVSNLLNLSQNEVYMKYYHDHENNPDFKPYIPPVSSADGESTEGGELDNILNLNNEHDLNLDDAIKRLEALTGDEGAVEATETVKQEKKVYGYMEDKDGNVIQDSQGYRMKDGEWPPGSDYGPYVHDESNMTMCFVAKTQIHMFDGSKKNIEDVRVGDEVLSMNNIKGIVTEHLIHPVNEKVKVANISGLIGEPHHPIYYNNQWMEMKDVDIVEYEDMYVDNYYNLEIDGDTIYDSEHSYIADGQIVSGLGDHEELNKVFQRQSHFKEKAWF